MRAQGFICAYAAFGELPNPTSAHAQSQGRAWHFSVYGKSRYEKPVCVEETEKFLNSNPRKTHFKDINTHTFTHRIITKAISTHRPSHLAHLEMPGGLRPAQGPGRSPGTSGVSGPSRADAARSAEQRRGRSEQHLRSSTS